MTMSRMERARADAEFAALRAAAAAAELAGHRAEVDAIATAALDGTLADRPLSQTEARVVALLAIFARGHMIVGTFDTLRERYLAMTDAERQQLEETGGRIMAAKAEIDWTSDDAAVIRSHEKIARTMDATAAKLERLDQRSKTTTADASTGFDKLTTSIGQAGMALIGGGSLLTAINMVSDANRKMLEEAQEVGKVYDETFRKFRVQAGLNALEAEGAKEKILAVAEKSAVDERVAGAAATQLVSSGFSVEEATGGSLREFLRIQAATNAAGKGEASSTELAKAMASYLESQGMAKTEPNLAKIGRGTQRLFKGTNVQLADFSELAKQGAALAPYMSVEEQLASFSTLVDVMPGAESATGLRNIVSRLSTAGASSQKVGALKKLGLAPTDVDLVGETLTEALGRMRGGVQGLPEHQRAGVLKTLFEEAGVPVFQTLANRAGDIPGRIEMQRDVKGFMQDVAIAESGRNAMATRLEAVLNRQKAREDEADDLVLKAIEAEARSRGVGPTGRMLVQTGYETLRGLSIPQEQALWISRPFGGGRDHREYAAAIYERMGAASGGDTGVKQLEQAIRENTKATEENSRAANAPAQRVVPSAQLAR